MTNTTRKDGNNCIKFIYLAFFGGWIYNCWGAKPSTVLLRAFYCASVWSMIPLIFYMLCFRVPVINHLSFQKYASFVGAFYGMVWAFHSSFRQEFVSKYQHLCDVVDKTLAKDIAIERISNDGDDVYIIDAPALNFVEDCLVFRMKNHDTFRALFLWIVGALIVNRDNHLKLFENDIFFMPKTKKYLELIRDGDIRDAKKHLAKHIEGEELHKCLSGGEINGHQ